MLSRAPLFLVVAAILSMMRASPARAALPEPPAPAAPDAASAAVAGGAPTLSRVMTLARERAPLVAAAREDLAVGRAELVGARLAPLQNPYVEVQANRGTQGATKDVSVTGMLWLPVEVSGQRGARVAEAEALIALREAGLDTARAAAVGEAVRAYGAAAVAGARIRAWERIVEVARDEAEVYAARLAARDATEQDEKLSRVELGRQTVVLVEARADLIRALADLSRLTGARFSDAPGSAEPPPFARRPAPERAPSVRALASEAAYHAKVRVRQEREAHSPLNLILSVGRGDIGEARFGGGVSWSIPSFRAGQGEAARADASRLRALSLKDVTARALATAVDGLVAEADQVRRAIDEINHTAEPAARAAVEAAVTMTRAGKSDLLAVLTARRDLALLSARRLDLTQRVWNILSDVVALTGELP